MIRYSVAHATLYESERFRRFLLWSGATHILLVVLFVFAPSLYRPSYEQAPVFVDLIAAAPAPAAAVAPPKQVVDEPIVIPKRPRAKPKPKAPAKPPPPVVKKPESKPKPSVSPEQILEQLRAKQAATSSAKSKETTGTAPQHGIFNPQMAAYTRKIQNLIYANWVGIRPFAQRSDLEVIYEVEIDAGGMLQSVRMIQSSGERTLDESAERAIYKSAPFPAPPPGIRRIAIRMNPREKA